MPEKIMLIDGNSIVNRAFYGIPLLSDAQGRYTNGVYGFLNILFKLLDDETPDYLAVAFDTKAPTFRHQQFTAYKGTRKGMPEELRPQIPLLKQVLTAMGVAQYEMDGFEADDILGTLSAKAEAAGLFPVVVSGDRDLLQLASDTLKVKIPKTVKGQTTIEDYYAADVVEKYGVTPLEFIDMKALMGDASDNIPGVPGIGEKTAAKIIQSFHSIENAIAHAEEVTPKRASENLRTYEEQARMSKELATIIRDMPLEMDLGPMQAKDFFTKEAQSLCRELGFKNLLMRFGQESPKEKTELPAGYRYLSAPASFAALAKELEPLEEVAVLPYEEEGRLLGLALYHEALGGVWAEGEKPLLAALSDFLEHTPKIAYEAKKDVHLLWRYGLEYQPVVFSADIAGYVLDSTRSSYPVSDMAQEYLNKTLPSVEEVLGKGKSKKSLLALTPEARTAFLAGQAEALWKAKPLMDKQIAENGQQALYYDMELPLVRVLADMEREGMKIDPEALREYGEHLSRDIDRLTGEIYALAGEEFNINSPKQLGVILFEKLHLPGGKKTKTGYSTAADVLEKLSHEHPLVEKVLHYRQLTKLNSTYVEGLLAVMDPKTHKIHSTFNQTIAATGRLSSTEPNLQNIPIRLELGRALRKVFIPSSPDHVFLDGDYSQIELRVLAHMAGDETLIDAFRHGQDIHRLTASQVFGVPFDQVTSLQRSNAKAVNFGIVYGIGAFSLSQDLGISRKEAEAYIEGYFAKYPKIKSYMDNTVKHAYEEGYVHTIFQRRRPMPELKAQNFVQRSFGERVAMNMPIQGSAADIIKIAMVEVHKRLAASGLRAKLILQVHDELLVEAHRDDAQAAAKLLQETMEHAVNLSVPMEVEVHEGHNWYEAK